MNRLAFLLVLVPLGCAAMPDPCPPWSDVWIRAQLATLANKPDWSHAICPKVGGDYAPPASQEESTGAHPAGTVSEACGACVSGHCSAASRACFNVDGGVCAAPDPAYAALAACITDNCAAPCPGVP